MLPYTQAEWRKTIAEVKRKYFSKRYRACSARCVEVLEGIKDVSQVEPIYLIYLHFYAATSMEICARPLPSASALRANLLQQARTHFDKASALINAAEDSVLRKFRPGSATSSRGSSCHSPSNSISSRAGTPDTRLSSPAGSVCSFDDLSPPNPPPSPPKRVKKVSFSLPKDATPLHIPAAEPIIRPDSPTLGGFDDAFCFSPTTPTSPKSMAEHHHQLPQPRFQEIELLPLQPIPETVESEAEDEPSEINNDNSNNDTYHLARSVDRCCEHLASLRAQLARHSTSLHDLLASEPSSLSSSSTASTAPPPAVAVAVAATRLPVAVAGTMNGNGSTGMGGGGGGGSAASAEEARRARIERLRRSGWQRKRFDGTRYEVLCEEVLAELE